MQSITSHRPVPLTNSTVLDQPTNEQTNDTFAMISPFSSAIYSTRQSPTTTTLAVDLPPTQQNGHCTADSPCVNDGDTHQHRDAAKPELPHSHTAPPTIMTCTCTCTYTSLIRSFADARTDQKDGRQHQLHSDGAMPRLASNTVLRVSFVYYYYSCLRHTTIRSLCPTNE